VLASAQQPTGIKLLGVAVEGNKTLTENSVKVQSGLVEGKLITQEDIATAIQNLWKLNLFADIKVLLDKDTEEGIFLIIKVEEYPRLGKFELRGNKKLSKSKIEEELNLIPGTVLSHSLVAETKRKLRKLYEKDGFLLVEIDSEIKETGRENVRDLTLIIKEGKRVRIKDITFEGNVHFSDSRLRRVLKETHRRNLWILRTGEYDAKKYEEDKDKLRAFYRKEGYRDFQILADSISYTPDNKRMLIAFKIYEGPRYRIHNITFRGNTVFTTDQLNQLLGFKTGDWYNEEMLQKALYDRINGAYMDKGYLFFQIVPEEIPVGEDEVDLVFDITENSIVSVGEINIVGNTKTHENVIRRELKIYPGDIFSRDALMRSQREVFVLNYFSNVTPDVVPIDDKTVDLELTVEEKSSDRANLSFSISEMYGLIGGGGFEFNNFRGRGQQLMISYQQGAQYSILGSGSNQYRSISLSFTDPWLFDSPNMVGGSIVYSERGGYGGSGYSSYYYYYPFDLSIYGGSLRWGRRFRWPDNYFRGSWSLAGYRKKYSNVDENYLKTVLLDQRRATSIALTQTISRDSRNSAEFPSMGSVFSLTSTLTGGPLGGTEHFHKHTLSFDFYEPTIWKLVLFNHAEFGVIKRLKRGGLIPPDERFIMGGSGMIYGVALRGYDDNQVGPLQYSSSYGSYLPYGGETYFKYSLEYRAPISENPTIYALVFVEAGNAWRTLKTTDPFDLKRSAGVGVRFFMPGMGMLGIDFGYGFDDIDPVGSVGYRKPEGWKTHFIFGMPF
jgi:outer membrane protein insertion porin family